MIILQLVSVFYYCTLLLLIILLIYPHLYTGSIIMTPGKNFLRDLDGNPVTDSQGRLLTVEPGTTVQEVDDDGQLPGGGSKPLVDKYGKSSYLILEAL